MPKAPSAYIEITNEVGQALQDCIDLAGNRVQLAQALGCTHQMLYKMQRNQKVPVNIALRLEKATGVPWHVFAPQSHEDLQKVKSVPGKMKLRKKYSN